jgi:hypothetical protein
VVLVFMCWGLYRQLHRDHIHLIPAPARETSPHEEAKN